MFHDSLFLYFALLAVPFSTLAGIAAYKRFYVGPPRFKEPEYFSELGGGPFVESLRSGVTQQDSSGDGQANKRLRGWRGNSTGMIGELLTSLLMIQDGWRQLPSQPSGDGTGIDGIFIRRSRDRSGGYDVCLAETKASTVSAEQAFHKYDKPLTHEVAEREVTALAVQMFGNRNYIDPCVASAIVEAIKSRSKHLTKQLFIHSFPDQTTLVYALDEQGRPGAYNVIADTAYKNLLESLEIGVARLARKVGDDNPIIGIIDRTKVAMTMLSVSMRPDLASRLGK